MIDFAVGERLNHIFNFDSLGREFRQQIGAPNRHKAKMVFIAFRIETLLSVFTPCEAVTAN